MRSSHARNVFALVCAFFFGVAVCRLHSSPSSTLDTSAAPSGPTPRATRNPELDERVRYRSGLDAIPTSSVHLNKSQLMQDLAGAVLGSLHHVSVPNQTLEQLQWEASTELTRYGAAEVVQLWHRRGTVRPVSISALPFESLAQRMGARIENGVLTLTRTSGLLPLLHHIATTKKQIIFSTFYGQATAGLWIENFAWHLRQQGLLQHTFIIGETAEDCAASNERVPDLWCITFNHSIWNYEEPMRGLKCV